MTELGSGIGVAPTFFVSKSTECGAAGAAGNAVTVVTVLARSARMGNRKAMVVEATEREAVFLSMRPKISGVCLSQTQGSGNISGKGDAAQMIIIYRSRGSGRLEDAFAL
jgi:hypothetical protein